MKKLTKRQIITIAISAVVVIALITTGIVLGTKSNHNEKNKETDKKVESVTKEDKKETEKEDSGIEETEKADTVVSEDDANNEETTSNDSNSTTSKNETNNKKNDTTNKTSTTKPSQTVTRPTSGHVHNWTEVKTQVAVPETGHYETVFEWKVKCCECDTELTQLTKDEQDAHFYQEPCKGGIKKTWRDDSKKQWVVDTPATTEARVVGYKCSCGATREKTKYAGMYTLYDQASWDRINACYQFFKQGLAGADTWMTGERTFLPYGNWESVVVSNGSTDGAWMWIFIRDWKLKDYSYLQDGVKEGIIDQAEADLVKALYEEIPSIFKGAIERVAPQGGTELYNYAVNLINQAGGNPDAVPSLAGAQGTIPENIPGLYVTIEETRGGFSLMFWAE